jgi:hypothetical protein
MLSLLELGVEACNSYHQLHRDTVKVCSHPRHEDNQLPTVVIRQRTLAGLVARDQLGIVR